MTCVNALSVNNRSDCVHSRLKEKEILVLDNEFSYTYSLPEHTGYELDQPEAEHSSWNQIKEKVLEEVGSPVSNTILFVPDPLNPTNKENDYYIQEY